MVPKKRASKRLTLKKKYKILKNAKDSKKKKKREMKRHPEKFPKQKDPGIPVKLPFYKQIIDELQEAKEKKEKRVLEARQLRKQKGHIVAKKRKFGEMNLAELLASAKDRGAEYDLKISQGEKEQGVLNDRSSKAYYREFKKVVEAADVVLQVLDARDPIGTRVTQLEAVVTGEMGKKLVLILNKADLVPRENLEKWLKYLRQEYPTLVFKSSTQYQSIRLGQTSAKIMRVCEEVMHTSKCLGADVLMQLLKNYCRNKDIKTAITVGVVGLPNVGKSSLINSLKRSRSCGVGATPGFTKSMQEIHLDSKIKLLDCPGIVLPGKGCDDATAALRNAIKLEDLADPITPVDAILARANKKQLMKHYRIPVFTTTEDFLALLAKRYGKLKKGGLPNREDSARKILHDWNTGVIKYYTQPPESPNTQVSASLVQNLSQEFDLNSLQENEGTLFKELPSHNPSRSMQVTTLGPVTQVMEVDGSQDNMSDMENDDNNEEVENDDSNEEEEDGSNTLLGKNVQINIEAQEDNIKPAEKKPRWETQLPTFDPETMSLQKYQKKMTKKARKERNRNEKRMDGLALDLDNMNCRTEDYDFGDYFK